MGAGTLRGKMGSSRAVETEKTASRAAVSRRAGLAARLLITLGAIGIFFLLRPDVGQVSVGRLSMSLPLIEAGLTLAAGIAALAFPQACSGAFAAVERSLARVARNRRQAVAAAGLAALLAGGAPRLFLGIPRPQQYDEFSYLLAADTFAHGRLTNPTHPLWQHFESFHINQLPTYMSMYPPAQGMTLALGKLIAGHAWFGVLGSVALMCALIVWMLQAWLPPGWALFGGLIAAMRIATFSYWIEGYWGGSVAAVGGALVLGAYPRLMKSRRLRDSLLLALGLAIVANSRPFEGLALAIPVAAILLRWVVQDPRRVLSLAPALVLLAVVGLAMLHYNRVVTGDPLLMPYAANRSQYAVAQVFIWQEPNPVPNYRHKAMRDFYTGWELTGFRLSKGWGNFESVQYEKIFKAWMFFFGPALTIALLPGWRLFKDRRIRPLVLGGLVSASILSISVYANPHYWAAYTALIYAVMMQGLRHVRTWGTGGRKTGAALVRWLPVVCLVLLGVRAAAAPLRLNTILGIPTWYSQFTPDYRREDVIARLKAMGGRHLVIVRYTPDHVPHQDWVYNDADIDGATIVWAREMDAARNAELLRYFRGRRVWLLQPDLDFLKLSEYTPLPSAPGGGSAGPAAPER